MKKISFILLPFITILSFYLLVPPFIINRRQILFQEAGNHSIPLIKDKVYLYPLPPQPNLNSISLQLKNPLLQNNSQIYVQILSLPENNIYQEFVISGANVGDPSWITFNFPPTTPTKLFVKVTTDNSQPETLFILGDSRLNWDLKAASLFPGYLNRLRSHLTSLSFRWQHFYFPTLLIYLFFLVTTICFSII